VSVDLIAAQVNKHRSSVYESLYVLTSQGYIAKRYDKTYRLANKPSVYFLTAKGISYLLKNTDLDQTTLKNFYKNRNMSQEYIEDCLNIFKIALVIKRQTNEKFIVVTKFEFDKKLFPIPPPDLFLIRKGNSIKPDYILEIFKPGVFSWLLRKRIKQHEKYAENSEYLYPDILFVSQNQSTENRLFTMIYENYEDFNYYIAQQDQLFNSGDGKVWVDPNLSNEEEIVRSKLI
jgi:hypothetical protein